MKGYKMTIKVGMRELSRNSNILDDHDYVEVEDKKTHKYKGLFISPKYADEFKQYLKEKKQKKIQEKLEALDRISGSCNGLFVGKTIQSIKSEMEI